MTPRSKIARVLKDIKNDSEINPDSKWVRFNFNTNIIGAGILSDDEEKRILLKLQGENIIKLHLPYGATEEDRGLLSAYTPEEFMMERDFIMIEILDGFYRKWFLYKFYINDFNYWKLTSPVWLIWEVIFGLFLIVKFFWKHKIISASMSILAAFIAIDYSLAWRNLKWVIDFILRLI